MKKKSTTSKSGPAHRILGVGGFLSPRLLVAVLLCTSIACSIVTATLSPAAGKLAFLRRAAPAKPSQRTLTFAERVSYQRAIEDVYWRHRIWPKERPDPKPPLDAVMTQAQLEKKVADYLRNSQALEDCWQRPITAEQLQAEMNRMATHSKQPEVLQELFEALGNDPFLIAECLARPVLSERLVTNFYAHDQRFHGDLKRRAETDLKAHLPAVASAEAGNIVEQMKQTSGTYSEIELVRSDSEEIVGQAPRLPNQSLAGEAPALQQQDSTIGLKLNSREWDENVQKLAAMFATANPAVGGFSDPKNGKGRPQPARRGGSAPTAQIKTGVLSSLQEDENRYYTTAVVNKTKDHLKIATIEWSKEPLKSWLATVEGQVPATMAAASAKYTLPNISDGATCTDDTWTATNDLPVSGPGHTAVWTGSEMIVWGGSNDTVVPALGGDLNTGGRYNPSTDSWTATNTTGAPTARVGHTAVWTGSEMIVWGGQDENFAFLNTGGRYNPTTDSWTATTTTNAPSARQFHTAVWTGSEMIVWGGQDPSVSSTGGRYNPNTDSWTATANAPTARQNHTAVWTGSEMIIWGGSDNGFVNTGARYNPGTNSWTVISTTNAPTARQNHTAVWTGSEMIIWGGDTGPPPFLNTGGRYNPSTDSWTATSTTNAPTARSGHTAVWTGSEMVVWAGQNQTFVNTGGRYNPNTDSWTATSITNAPTADFGYTGVWSGTEMIVWDGSTGGRYNPSMDSWIGTGNPPTARDGHTAVWTGSEMIIWGGGSNTGGRYNPSTDSWTATSTTNTPTARSQHTAVWTGSEMIVWGGSDGTNNFNSGGRYNPDTDSWIPTTTTNAPTARFGHTAVWTGSEMIVWGGGNDSIGDLSTGGKYNPGTNSWTATSIANAPLGRTEHTAVWTGNEMIVWGGAGSASINSGTNTGGRYNPSTDSWTDTSITNAPTARTRHTAVWTGFEMIVWGGLDAGAVQALNSGARYNPSTDSWAATSLTNAPFGLFDSRAVWTGSEMIVWGGVGCPSIFCLTNGGVRYNPSTDSWTDTSITNAPTARTQHTAVWTGSEMIVWGGSGFLVSFNTGGRYCAQPPPVLSQLGNISTRAFVQTGDNVMIGGFIVRGSQLKRVIIRAIGPELTQYGVPNPLSNPTLELHDATGELIASNDNWQFTIIGGIITHDQGVEIRESGHAPGNPLESAIIADLPPGNYTAIVRGVNNTTGVALAEVYDLSPEANSLLGNISTRGFVQTGDNVIIGGFIVEGSQPKRVIIRAIGPELTQYGVPDALANPTLELHNAAGTLIASNDNWMRTIIGGIITSNQGVEIRDSGYAPADGRESAIIATLPLGNYTAIVRGVNNTTGVALVEVYDLQ